MIDKNMIFGKIVVIKIDRYFNSIKKCYYGKFKLLFVYFLCDFRVVLCKWWRKNFVDKYIWVNCKKIRRFWWLVWNIYSK